MESEPNILRRHDLDSLAAVERAFHTGPLSEVVKSAPQLERRKGLTLEEFEREYRHQMRPVVLEGFVEDWPSVQKWSFDHLAERCGSVRVIVDSYNTKAAREATVAEFVTMLKENEGDGATPIYLQEWYYQTTAPELADDMPEMDIAQYDFRRNLYGDAPSTNHQLWLGQKGGVTRLHQDSYTVDVMHAQIVGEKLWYVMGPKAELRADTAEGWKALCDSPDTELMQFTLKPGDVVYLPANWYHRIELLSDSIGLGRKCLDEANLRTHIRQRMGELLALALNPDEVKRTHPELFDVVLMRSRAWANRMNIDLSRLRP
ncbi:cupin-like protein [Streptomyces sp. BK022]|uniref:cupin-like domain-containing protein n=1 Tax=Streptomyces sp. BK022 TaxID=2512123 RepID=UPI001028B06F|nr:cupin-like domain-containing protein [Streptomyces sp. BK022]RZU44116.1 cupin-like protein [Streptomyces sp. BK022]